MYSQRALRSGQPDPVPNDLSQGHNISAVRSYVLAKAWITASALVTVA
jgi:hypothetical protein